MLASERVLSPHQVLFFFIVLSLAYVFPIVHADYAYVDDNWRALLQAQGEWGEQGRILLEWLYWALSFSKATINIFPLPLLISVFALAWAMARLTFWLFPSPGITRCLVIFPVLGNPFFLGNLSYQYDGPGMVLALVAVICAVTCRVEQRLLRLLISAVLIAVTLSLYQLTISLFIGLCVVEYVQGVKDRTPVDALMYRVAERVGQLLVGGIFYFLTAYQLTFNARGKLLAIDQQWLGVVYQKFCFSLEMIDLLVASIGNMVAITVLVLASAGFMVVMKNILHLQGSTPRKAAVALLYLLSVVVLIGSVPGIMLFLAEPNLDARNFIGFSAVLMVLFFFIEDVLGRVSPKWRVLLVVPTVFMFMLSYAYGQVLIAKKELESAMAGYIAQDIVGKTELMDVQRFYYVGPRTAGNWLPRGHGAMAHLPVLRYLLSTSNTVLHPHFFPRLGINNVVEGRRDDFEKRLEAGEVGTPVVNSKFYAIYLSAEAAFIVMKEISDPENYNDNWLVTP
ncbi:glucosyltransferase domain-containing protein [Pseudomonas vranovensis]|uniref:glucosyltransferase domain-containing protein n=1 Tax=Pseudomonas vranovensis TaxID=321661 RepID=UPI00160722F8|nr:glucosyltransferase domain-containing protein [Pseudomonas vranovensis]